MSRLLAGKSACATSSAGAGRVRGFCLRLHQNVRPYEGVMIREWLGPRSLTDFNCFGSRISITSPICRLYDQALGPRTQLFAHSRVVVVSDRPRTHLDGEFPACGDC
jgi:hypothetical protein